jgi:hypothetical protein
MIVQGALLLFFALIMIGYAIFVSRMDEFMPVDQQAAEMQEMMEMQKVFTIVFVVVSGCGGLLGIMHFVAAYFGFNYKYRVFGIITMILGLSSMMTFYCAPTAIGLAVYGLIIYFNPAVAKAFQLRKTGTKKQEILGHFPY